MAPVHGYHAASAGRSRDVEPRQSDGPVHARSWLRRVAAWSIVNDRRLIGYAPEDGPALLYADEIRAYLVEPARRG